MINIKPIIVAALKNDALLISLLDDQQRIYHTGSVQEAKLPCVTYFELENEPFATGDEQELVSKVTYQLDIWQNSGKSTTEITLAVNRIMTTLGGTRERAPDSDEEAPKECRMLVYSFIVDNEMNFY